LNVIDDGGLSMLSKVLIANRGEIAARIIKTCKRLGIRTVAIYSDADKDAVHTRLADEAYRVGESPPLRSYLSIPNILDAVSKSGADGVHPGYGFLSEFHEFGAAVEKTGAVWIGPKPETMRLVGSKTYTRRVARENGIPTIPGAYHPVSNAGELEPMLQEHGTLLIKPDEGGGGKGTRKVSDLPSAAEGLEAASREAKLYFGNGAVYAEKLLDRPRHVEAQILADNYGNIVHLFERECSLQRRFQKVIEEAPSLALTEDQRRSLLETAVGMAKAIGYNNAGTFEFLFEESSGRFYMLEINKRLQVEHPVTEMTTGMDIVEHQIRIASGEELSVKQSDIVRRGHSIEARIYAEDPRNFTPSPGRVTKFSLKSLPHVRVDHALESGTNVSFYYDPLIAKVISWGENRAEAISRMREALSEIVIEGIKTTLPLHRVIFGMKDFEDGRFDTTYLEERLPQIQSQIRE
jgi:acetyl/propionyl-CoA carboxylase alpha subunit